MSIFGREPAAIIGFVTAALGLGTALNVHGMSGEQVSLIVAAITAVGGAVMALRTRPVAPAAFTAAVSAIAALVAGYGYDLSPQLVGAVQALVLSVLTLLTRAQVSPTPAAAVTRPGSHLAD